MPPKILPQTNPSLEVLPKRNFLTVSMGFFLLAQMLSTTAGFAGGVFGKTASNQAGPDMKRVPTTTPYPPPQTSAPRSVRSHATERTERTTRTNQTARTGRTAGSYYQSIGGRTQMTRHGLSPEDQAVWDQAVRRSLLQAPPSQAEWREQKFTHFPAVPFLKSTREIAGQASAFLRDSFPEKYCRIKDASGVREEHPVLPKKLHPFSGIFLPLTKQTGDGISLLGMAPQWDADQLPEQFSSQTTTYTALTGSPLHEVSDQTFSDAFGHIFQRVLGPVLEAVSAGEGAVRARALVPDRNMRIDAAIHKGL